MVVFGIGHHFTYAVDSWLQLEGGSDIHPALEEIGKLRVKNAYPGASLLQSNHSAVLVENAEDEGQRVYIVLAFFMKMQRFRVQVGK